MKPHFPNRYLTLALVGIILTAGVVSVLVFGLPWRISHQPKLLSQMERLVMPKDPSVEGIVNEVLGEARYDGATTPRTLSSFAALRKWVYGIGYEEDRELHGVEDYWQTPAETINLGKGDCEDIAILFVSLLRAYGVPAEDAYVAVGFIDNGHWHAFVFEKCCFAVWRTVDPQKNELASLLSNGLGYNLAYCFNDRLSTRSFVLPESDNSLVLALETIYPFEMGAVNVFRREFEAGETANITLRWLTGENSEGLWQDFRYPWSLSIYDWDGVLLSSWTGKEANHSLEFTAEKPGIYYLTVIKRDSATRYFKLDASPANWASEPFDGFKPIMAPPHDAQAQMYLPTELVPEVQSPPPQELVDYILAAINQERQYEFPAPKTVTLSPSFVVEIPAAPPLKLGYNRAAQAHAEDMLARQYFALWDSSGLTPDIRHFLAGGSSFAREDVYFTKMNWTRAKDQYYIAYLKSLLDMGVASSGKSFAEALSTPDFYTPYYRSVNIGLAYDDNYLFLVLDYEYRPQIVLDASCKIEDGTLILSGALIDKPQPSPVSIYFVRSPESITPPQLNDTGLEASGQWIASISKPNSLNDKPDVMVIDNWPALTDPRDIPAGCPAPGLAERDGVLKYNGSTGSSISVYLTPASSWHVENNRFYITADLSAVVGAYGPGIYTIYLSAYDGSFTPQASDFASRTSYSFFLK